MNKYRVTLTVEERAELERLVSVGKGAARKLTHARILLLADTAAGAEQADEEIVAALRVGLCTVGRVRQRLVTQGLSAALNPKAQPQRPDKIKIKGDVEQELIRLACSDPPEGRCHWTLQLLAAELVVLGLVEDISAETVRQALKKTTSNRGSSRLGASRRTRMPTMSGGWKRCSRPTCCRTIQPTRSSVLTKPASTCSARSGRYNGLDQACQPAWTTNTSARGYATSC